MGSISLACPPARLRWGGRPTAGFSNFGGDFLARHRRHGHGAGHTVLPERRPTAWDRRPLAFPGVPGGHTILFQGTWRIAKRTWPWRPSGP
ncbi:hypothetical protein Ct61P_15607 [Colletotrichum tofieldiae]|nr:hypothetical protein Ct61P_15607 [Colletotrichum tofieldiae]